MRAPILTGIGSNFTIAGAQGVVKMSDTRTSDDVTVPKITTVQGHPSHSLAARRNGFGIGGGYERPYKHKEGSRSDNAAGLYSAIAEGGHFVSGDADQRFRIGQAGFKQEQSLYKSQFGEQTSGYNENK
jgi:hypothetical protein